MFRRLFLLDWECLLVGAAAQKEQETEMPRPFLGLGIHLTAEVLLKRYDMDLLIGIQFPESCRLLRNAGIRIESDLYPT
jgi:hypothetical protein